ncbi:MAG: phosphate ABC transporter substrate-binding protein PstS [Pseudomonadota bacterium]
MQKSIFKKISVVILSFSLGIASVAIAAPKPSSEITGAGSSFIYPVMMEWIKQYLQAEHVTINYQSIGSGGGISQLKSGTIEFAASDEPLKTPELNQLHWTQFPMITGGIVMAINVKGIKSNQLVLDGNTVADIYLGKIKYWDNKEIAALNPGLKLPHQNIITIHRSDGSGTTFNFTYFLSQVNPTWKSQVGFSTAVKWEATGIGAKGNAGVAAQIAHFPGAIGYVEFAYAKQNNLSITKMKNKAGKVVEATPATFTAAAENGSWTASNNFYELLSDKPGDQSWPMVATTFILMPSNGKNLSAADRQAILKFFTWCYENGDKAAASLDYVNIPKSVYQKIIASWSNTTGSAKAQA